MSRSSFRWILATMALVGLVACKPKVREAPVTQQALTPPPQSPVADGEVRIQPSAVGATTNLPLLSDIWVCDLNRDSKEDVIGCSDAGLSVFERDEQGVWTRTDSGVLDGSCHEGLCGEGVFYLATGMARATPKAPTRVRVYTLEGNKLLERGLLEESTGPRNQVTGLALVPGDEGAQDLYISRFVDQLSNAPIRLKGIDPKNTEEGEAMHMAMRRAWVDIMGDGKYFEVIGRLYGDKPRTDGGVFFRTSSALMPVPTMRGVRAMTPWPSGGVLFGDGWHFEYRDKAEGRINHLQWEQGMPKVTEIGKFPGQTAVNALSARQIGEQADGQARALVVGDTRSWVGRLDEVGWVFQDLGDTAGEHPAAIIADHAGLGVLVIRANSIERLPLQ